jgi:hypothetical protein
MVYDKKALQVFLNDQGKLFDEPVAESLEEADEFLDDCCAVIENSRKDALSYMKDNLDCEGMSDAEILDSAEVFDLGDGRYLIVEG